MGKAGRKTLLTKEVFREIKKGILEGKQLQEIADSLNLERATLYDWTALNYHNLATMIEIWKRDRLLMKSENVLADMIDMPVLIEKSLSNDEVVVKTDPQLVRIKQDTAKFIAETLGKKDYSKRNELTGLDGERLFPKPLLGGQSNDTSNNSNKEAINFEEED